VINDKERLERDILALIRDFVKPVGCGAIAAKLQGKEHHISEATVGRILREMDVAGYTEKSGFQGRALSPKGLKRLEELENKKRRSKWETELIQSIQGHTKEQLLEVLIARRAIESELAYLAAQNATDQEIQHLREIVERQRVVLADGRGAAEEDVNFHATIAAMSRNRVLEAAIALIRQDTQLSPVLEFIRLQVHSFVLVDHQAVLEHILNRKSDQAKTAMIEHMNNLIRDVEKYWESMNQKTFQSAGMSSYAPD